MVAVPALQNTKCEVVKRLQVCGFKLNFKFSTKVRCRYRRTGNN